jgi:hypothetical protein
MVSRSLLLQATAAVAISFISAIAQAAPAGDKHDGDHPHPDFAAWHQQMCTDQYAHRVGDMAYLETKLSLNDSQHALFAQWKDTVLSRAKDHEGKCLSRTARDGERPSLIDRESRMHDMLQARLAELDAEQPSMTSLYNSLSGDQKHVFDMMGMQRHSGEHGGWHHHAPGGQGMMHGEHGPDHGSDEG